MPVHANERPHLVSGTLTQQAAAEFESCPRHQGHAPGRSFISVCRDARHCGDTTWALYLRCRPRLLPIPELRAVVIALTVRAHFILRTTGHLAPVGHTAAEGERGVDSILPSQKSALAHAARPQARTCRVSPKRTIEEALADAARLCLSRFDVRHGMAISLQAVYRCAGSRARIQATRRLRLWTSTS